MFSRRARIEAQDHARKSYVDLFSLLLGTYRHNYAMFTFEWDLMIGLPRKTRPRDFGCGTGDTTTNPFYWWEYTLKKRWMMEGEKFKLLKSCLMLGILWWTAIGRVPRTWDDCKPLLRRKVP